MGVRLIVEVMDHWQDAGLSAGERADLLVLAENANDGSRLTWGPVHEPYILRRANKSAAGWKNSIGKLIKKGVLAQHKQGYSGQAAVYRLARLCPEVKHDGWKGFCVRPERVTPEVTLSEGGPEKGHLTDDPQGHSSGDPLNRKGHLTGAERVTSQVTPTPLSSPSLKISSNTSSSAAEPSSLTLGRELATEGGGGVSPSEQNQQAEALVDALDYRGVPPRGGTQDRHQLLTLVAAALDAGWAEQDLKTYLDLRGADVATAVGLYKYRLSPKQLPDAETFRDGQRAPLVGTDALVAGWGAVAASFDTRGPQRGYRPADPNAVWERYDAAALAGEAPARADQTPWCGDPDCDEITRTHQVEDEGGLKSLRMCTGCHPAMRF